MKSRMILIYNRNVIDKGRNRRNENDECVFDRISNVI